MTDRERIEDLAALAAAGGATGTERAEVDSLAAGDAEIRALVREYGDAASLMALGLDEPVPPMHVLENVRLRVRGRTPVQTPIVEAPRRGNVVPIGSARKKPSATVMVAVAVPIAAAAAFAVLWIMARGASQDAVEKLAGLEMKLDEAERRERLAAGAMVAAQRKLEEMQGSFESLATPNLQLVTVNRAKPDAPIIKVLVDKENRRWVVLAFDLPPIPADKDYQLWFMPEKGDPISAGILQPGPGKSQFGSIAIPPDLEKVKGAAISLEPKGGSATPTMDQIQVAGDLL